MNNKKTTQYTNIFTWKPNVGENHIMFFSYMSLRITLIGRNNFLFSPTTTGRRLRPPVFSGYNPREATTPQFFDYN
jgi:hypothetical protein